MKKQIFFLAMVAVFLLPDSLAYAEQKNYVLSVDEQHSYDLSYTIDAEVIAMAIDTESKSLLIGIQNTRDSAFEIQLPSEMIAAENNQFAVLIDGFEIDYQITEKGSGIIMVFFVPEGTQEIEIIGTHIIPEFPSAFLLFTFLVSTTIFLAKNGKFTHNR